jgi:cytochrome c-type biogenesis protein CcmE
MNRNLVIGLVLVAAAIFIFINATQDVSTYSDFTSAETSGETVKLVGVLAKDKPYEYNPEVAPNEMTFFLKDQKGIEKKVILKKAKPQGFEMSEQIVLTGKMNKDDVFIASEILMKCPSKYKNEEINLKSQS